MTLISTPEQREEKRGQKQRQDERALHLATERSQQVVKALFTMNGAALLATLTLTSQVFQVQPDIAQSMIYPALFFLAGLLAAVFTLFFDILLPLLSMADLTFWPEKVHVFNKVLKGVLILGMVVMLSSLISFIVGAIWVAVILI